MASFSRLITGVCLRGRKKKDKTHVKNGAMRAIVSLSKEEGAHHL